MHYAEAWGFMNKQEIIDILAVGGITPVAVESAYKFDVSVIPPIVLGDTWQIQLRSDQEVDEAINLFRGNPGAEDLSYVVLEEIWTPEMGDPALN